MLTHLVTQEKLSALGGIRYNAACGVSPKPGSHYTEFKEHVTCHKCKGTKLYDEAADTPRQPVHTDAIKLLETELSRRQHEIDVAVEDCLDTIAPLEFGDLEEQRDDILMSLETLRALQNVALMAKK